MTPVYEHHYGPFVVVALYDQSCQSANAWILDISHVCLAGPAPLRELVQYATQRVASRASVTPTDDPDIHNIYLLWRSLRRLARCIEEHGSTP